MNKAILNKEVQHFIHENLGCDLSKIILKGSPFPEVSIQEIAAQISGLQKAKQKLPTWFKTKNILFPPTISLEQTSSEVTAEYKASLISGTSLIDLTGGFGIDSYYLSNKVERLIYCEVNSDLSEIAAHNFDQLGSENIETFCGNSFDFLENTDENFDWIYLDPARRNDNGGKVFLLEQCTPDVPENMNLLFNKADHILIKTSPLLDLTSGIRDLKKVSEIHIVSVNNQVKELLWILHKSILSKTKVKTINFQKEQVQKFEADYVNNSEETPLALPKKYLYEPNPAVMKSGLFSELARQTKTAKLHLNSHLYTSDELITFPGRTFKVLKVIPFNKKLLKKEFGAKKANITTRNFPQSVDQIRKELKISEGGDQYLFFTTNLENKKIVIICKRPSKNKRNYALY